MARTANPNGITTSAPDFPEDESTPPHVVPSIVQAALAAAVYEDPTVSLEEDNSPAPSPFFPTGVDGDTKERMDAALRIIAAEDKEREQIAREMMAAAGPKRKMTVQDAKEPELVWVQKEGVGWIQEAKPDASTITVDHILEAADQYTSDLDLGPAWNEGRGRDMAYWWASGNPNQRNLEHRNHLDFVKPDDLPWEVRARFQVKDGKVFCGDSVLMESPHRLRDTRRARLEAMYKADAADKRNEPVMNMQEGIARLGMGNTVQVEDSRNETRYDTFGGEGVDADLYAEAMAQRDAETMLDDQRSGRSHTSTQFGGLGGPPEYDQWQRTGPKQNGGYVAPRGY